jgi:hypothetical protein
MAIFCKSNPYGLLILGMIAGMIIFYGGCDRIYDENYRACDKNYIPYDIEAFDVWVYNDKTDKEYYAGRITTNYNNAQQRLSDAQSLAYDFADSKNLKDWSYICCTVNSSSNCVTKVR